MSIQLEAVQGAVGAFNAGDIDTYMGLYAASAVFHGYAPGPISFDEAKEFYAGLRAAFPDGELAADDVLQDGEKLCVRFHLSGTHQGDLLGITPTGRQVVLTGQTILRFEGAKVVERWQAADMLGLLQQLGAVPALT